MIMRRASNIIRSLLFPGLDLHTRNRASLARYWRSGPRDVLDAGSGNGYFSWLAYRSGARVVAMNYEQPQVERSRELLLGVKRADPVRLCFEQRNLYDLKTESRRFDEILCFEVLEHLTRDSDVVQEFYRLLRPGGWLHICCPNKLHPRHQREVLDLSESGGHVRAGYTEMDFRSLLEPIGYKLDLVAGIGTPGLYQADRLLRAIRIHAGDWLALPLLPLALPFVWLAKENPAVPFSIYVRAVKPSTGDGAA